MTGNATRRMRPLGLLDVMALVAATALGLVWARYGWTQTIHYQIITLTPSRWAWLIRAPHALLGLTPCLACWTLVLFGLQWRGPRPAAWRLFRRPGVAACAAATLALAATAVAGLARSAATAAGRGNGFDPGSWKYILSGFGFYATLLTAPCATAVATAWAILLLTGRVRADRSGLDRAGIALGFAWLAWVLIDLWAHYNLVANPPGGWSVGTSAITIN